MKARTNITNDRIRSTCSYCGVGCGVLVGRDARGRVTVEGDPDHPVNRGMLCSKGLNLHYTVRDRSDRLLYPEMRWNRGGDLERVDWDTALGRAAAVFGSIIERHGPDSVGFYVSGQLLTEEYYLVNKLAKGFIGTANIDTNSRLCMSSAVVGYKKALGEDAVPIAYEDIDDCDLFLIAGANPAWCHPILFRRIEARRAADPEAKVIVVDPRRTDSTQIADLHLQIAPGTDVTLYNAIARRLIEGNLVDADFIENHTEGFAELKRRVFRKSIREAAEICAIPGAEIETAARMIGDSKTLLSFWAMGLNQSAMGVEKNLALINLNLLTGRIGRPGCGPFSLTGQPNAMGGREVGGLANMLAAHRELNDPEHRAEVARHWDVPVERIPAAPGLSAIELFDAVSAGKVRALWIICTNPMVSLPDSKRVREALKNAAFVVVQDISRRSDTAEFADLILPAAGWLEKEGTMTNSERRVSFLPRAIAPPEEARPDADILTDFARRLGFQDGFDHKNAADVYAEHAALTKGTNLNVGGLDHRTLKKNGPVQWPVPEPDHPGTPRLFTDRKFYTPSGRARLSACDDRITSEALDEDFPLVLTTGRVRDQWHTMTRTGKVRRLGRHAPEPFLEIHPLDAERLAISENRLVVVKSRRGRARLRARVTDRIKPGVVFAPMHWGKILQKDLSRANNLTAPRFDPVSKEPDFKFSAVAVEPYERPREKILIVGAGAAAFAFIEEYRKENRRDPITVLCREPHPFYNRILLPEYINGERNWDSLLMLPPGFLAANNVRIHYQTSAREIDRAAKRVIDEKGAEHEYDRLILATGSRARTLPSLQDDPAVFSLRSKADADRIAAHAGGQVLIIGGGLLGLELAGALQSLGKKTMIVHRSPRLMSRQLNAAAATILETELERRGVELHLGDEVLGVYESRGRRVAYLASGKRLECSGIVCALGTEPETSLAREAGLRTNYGIVVDDYLTTSDPAVYAAGENCEWNRRTYGTSLAAQEQARILARVIAGDPAAHYDGSIQLNILKIEGLPLASMGKTRMTEADEEEIVFSDTTNGVYKSCLIRDDRLIGCILVGDTGDLGRFKDLHENGVELGEDRRRLLGGATEAPPPRKGAPVCSCNNVGAGNIKEAIQEGARDLAALCERTGAGTGCGSCRTEVARHLDQINKTKGMARAS